MSRKSDDPKSWQRIPVNFAGFGNCVIRRVAMKGEREATSTAQRPSTNSLISVLPSLEI